MADLTQAPYFDDYDPAKGYHRILFKPGRAVQVREFNQLQTILQEQIKRFGNNIFENGAMVIPGETNYNLNYEYVTIGNVDYSAISEILETNEVTVTGQTSGVVAQVMQYQPNTQTDPITFYLQYLNGSEDGSVSRFVNGETLLLETATGINFAKPICVGTGVGSVFTVNAGVFYINGFFVETDQQSIVMSRYSSFPSVVVGFRLKETFIDWTQDQTLLDNSSGSTNFNAIGADRLKMELNLEVHALGSSFDAEDFIELATFKAGQLQKIVKVTDYSVLEDTLARRTYDESGDYSVNAFGIDIREHLDTGLNGGLFPVEEGGDATKFAVGVEAGKAYVRGYEVTNISTQYLPVDKAREVGFVDNSTFALPLGAYIEATGANIAPRIGKIVKFYSGTPASAGAIPSGTMLGTGYLVSVDRQASGVMRLYLIRIRNASEANDTSFIANAKSVYIDGSPAFTSAINSILRDPTNSGLLYKLPVDNAKTLLDDGSSDTSLVVIRQVVATADTNGNVILTAGTNETFVTPTSTTSFASYGSTIVSLAGITTLGGTPTGSTMTVALGSPAASASVTLTVLVAKQTAGYKAKTLTTTSVTVAPTDIKTGNVFYLGKADAVKLNSVKDANGADVTSKYTLKRNANTEYYGVSYIALNSGESVPTTNLTINFDYFIHGTSGSFFSADSYSVPYENIPLENVDGVITRASDFIDFRPRKGDANANDFTGVGSTTFEIPQPYSLLRADIQFYLPRIDKVYVNSKGSFGTIKGVPALNPKEPKTPENSMLLYRLYIPAYTLSSDDVKIEKINNRRYTMRDIGALEDRISNLEYYTTLSLLETETSALQITDSTTGLNRFKNGFVVDSFTDLSTSLWSSPDFKCAIDPNNAELRPGFYANQIDMEFDGTSSAVKTGSLVTLPYTEVLFLQQAFASNTLNVNPYAVYRWYGQLTLSPNSDTWTETQYQTSYQGSGGGNSASTVYTFGGSNVTTNDFNDHVKHATIGVSSITGTATTTVTSTSTSTYIGGVIASQDIPYMRARDVQFTVKGLKPYTQMYAFFDNTNVGSYCRQTGKANGAAMVSDENGNLTGTFSLPNSSVNRFRTGTKRFTLNDNTENVKETSLSYADADYTAKGTLETRERTIVTTTTVSTVTVPWDPLAQSFFIEKDGGVFLTSVDVFFATKDKDANITLEIRSMVNGTPGSEVVPYSTVILNSSEVNVSETANVATKFKFPSPVYLADGSDYCFVLMSNSNNYNVYIATMGNKMIGSNAYISKQPYIGVLFKSQNNVTWTEDQSSDMKFNINVAKFVTNQNFTASFKNDVADFIQLANNPLTSTNGSGVIQANIPNHGLFVGSNFAITGVDIAPGLDVTKINAVQTVTAVIDADTIQFSVTGSANATGSFGGASVLAERNTLIDVIYPNMQELLFDNTSANWTVVGTTGKSISGSETPYQKVPESTIVVNQVTELPYPFMVPSASEKAKITGNALTINANLVTYADNISPVIDVNRIGVVGISNRINNPAVLSESAATGGNAIARYLTNIVGLKQPATSLKVYLDMNKPQGSTVNVYYRVGNSEEELNVKTWALLNTITSVTASDVETFSEAEFGKDSMAAFGYYQFKIVMTSSSSSNVPRCKRLRGIALGT